MSDATLTKTLTPIETKLIEQQVYEATKEIFDPEIPVSIFEMGLIYDVLVNDTGFVNIRMTLTAPACPAAQSLPAEVDEKARNVGGVSDVKVDIVWDPPWTMDMMSDEAKLQLGLY